jgi:hypothetical protein
MNHRDIPDDRDNEKMPETSLIKIPSLRLFQIDVRDKELVKSLFFKLEVRMLGWNLPALFEKYCVSVDPSLSTECHYRLLLRLSAILISGDNETLIDDPSATFSESDIDLQLVQTFMSQFVGELKQIVCVASKPVEPFAVGPNSSRQKLHGDMTGAVYAKMGFRSPAVSAITAIILILLADMYALTLCKTPIKTIAESLTSRIRFS